MYSIAVISCKNDGSLCSTYGKITPVFLVSGRRRNQRHITPLLSHSISSFSKMPHSTCPKKIPRKTSTEMSFQNNLKTDLKKQINPFPANVLIEMFFSKPRFLIPLALLLLTHIILLHPSLILGRSL